MQVDLEEDMESSFLLKPTRVNLSLLRQFRKVGDPGVVFFNMVSNLIVDIYLLHISFVIFHKSTNS